MLNVSLEASNSADWKFHVEVADDDTGDLIDLTGATLTVSVRDENDCQALSGTSSDGTITITSVGEFDVAFAVSKMKGLSPATYQIGCVIEKDDEQSQLFVGSVAVYDGVIR